MTNYTELVNVQGIRKLVRRQFTGKMDEVLGELLQNSQRAGATEVRINTWLDGFEYADNGHGIIGGVDGFHKLLKMAETSFENDAVWDQDPMGVGIHSLLANDQVQSVTFASRGLELTINPKPWWNDVDYYTSWVDRMVSSDVNKGFVIRVSCSPQLVNDLYKLINPDYGYHNTNSPHVGYGDIFRMVFNGEDLFLKVPETAKPSQLWFSSTYQGHQLLIGHRDYASYVTKHNSYVNWYGQLIPFEGIRGVSIYLHVRSGRPVNPMSPSRRGLIDDAALRALREYVLDQCFAFIRDPKNFLHVTPLMLQDLHGIDAARFGVASAFGMARRYEYDKDDYYSDTRFRSFDSERVFLKSDPPLLVEDKVYITLDGEEQETWRDYGIHSFLSDLGTDIYQARLGFADVDVHQVWWWPGQEHAAIADFYGRGSFALSLEGRGVPTEWQPVTSEHVYGFDTYVNTDFESAEWFIGTDDPKDFLESPFAWAPQTYEDSDYDSETTEEKYQESLHDLIRSLKGDTISRDFHTAVREIMHFCGRNDVVSLVPTIRKDDFGYVYGINEVTVYFEDGTSRVLNVD